MNFGYSISGLLKGRKVTTSVWDRKTCVRLSAEDREKIREIVDTFGWNSAQAQGLSRPLTDYNRLKSSDHRLYLICKPHWVRGTRVIGGLRCGRKHLYFQKEDGYEECEPMCVLDFYIHERYQRKGIGRRLFRAFLEAESEQANTIAYDRPSSKLLGFLKKYYGLSRSVHQNNNFAVFDTFFDKAELIRVRSLEKATKSGYISRMSRNSSRHRSSKTTSANAKSATPPKSQKSTTSASSSIISRYSGYQKSSRASTTSVDSIGKPYEPFSRASRPPLRPLPKRVASQLPAPSQLPMGPYPGWQPLESAPRLERRKKKDSSIGLTRLSPIKSFTRQEPPTPACRCIPPWATGLAADRTGIVKKIVTASAITHPKHPPSQDSSESAYKTYRGRHVDAIGAKSCLHWAAS